jgi:hypothetical protein
MHLDRRRSRNQASGEFNFFEDSSCHACPIWQYTYKGINVRAVVRQFVTDARTGERLAPRPPRLLLRKVSNPAQPARSKPPLSLCQRVTESLRILLPKVNRAS